MLARIFKFAIKRFLLLRFAVKNPAFSVFGALLNHVASILEFILGVISHVFADVGRFWR